MDTKQAIQAIKLLSSLEFDDEVILKAIDSAINKIRDEALIQCEDNDVSILLKN